MFLRQFVNEGLGNCSYLVGSLEAGEAAVIDPQRDVDTYTREARKAQLKIRYSLETHLHADFVSGSRELAAATGAAIGASEKGHARFPHIPLREGDHLDLGEVSLEVVETPGHSPEHISFLLFQRGRRAPSMVFSGGALTVGGVARTDLLGHEHAIPLARQAYHSLRDKLLRLGSNVRVYPTHGGGSYCVAAQTEERATSIGRERRANELVGAEGEDDFVHLALEGLPPYPAYYRWMRPINEEGPRVLGGVPRLEALPPPDMARKVREGALVVDVRPVVSFARGHIPKAYNILLRESFSSWLGWLLPMHQPLVFVVAARQPREQIARQCIRIGYDDMAGYLKGGMRAWRAAGLTVEKSGIVTPQQLVAKLAAQPAATVLDVREKDEWCGGHIPRSVHIPLGQLQSRIAEVPRGCPISVTCSHGIRGSAGASILKRHGFKDVENVLGGTTAWQEADLPLTTD